MKHQHSYTRIAIALMPQYPVIINEAKIKIAEKAAVFISMQFSKQPFYLLYPLRLLSFSLALTIKFFGPKAMIYWSRMPFGGMIERLFRSLVTLIFLEDENVLAALGELTGEERINKFRAIRNG
ncbi:MAG: hypothetical protein P8H57_10105 [Emcibacteraceae bacterium]|nr:hypothetical protein [Emcibacteraceae bacterium]